jgi:poly(3-hydroxybutyrate) depolymerase
MRPLQAQRRVALTACIVASATLTAVLVINTNSTALPCGQYILRESRAYPAPLILDMHGQGMTAYDEMITSGYANFKDAHIVWPEGYKNAWAIGEGAYPPASTDNIDHVACLSNIIRETTQKYDISFVVATGMSSGCAMAQRLALATEYVDVVACASHGVAVFNTSVSSNVDFLLVMGELDHIWLRGVPNTLRLWSEKNECNGYSVDNATFGLMRTYDCKHGRMVYILLADTDHFFHNQAAYTLRFINQWNDFER